MPGTEWVDYQACPADVRHLRLGSGPCRLCASPAPADRALTSAGLLHWLVWQQTLAWADRHRPGQVLDLTTDDFVAWAAADPAGHRRYVDFLEGSATFGTADVTRPTRGWVIAPAQPPATVILQPDGSLDRPEHRGPARWGFDAAGVLVLMLEHDRAQHRVVGQRSGLHVGRRTPRGGLPGEPVFFGLWSDGPTGTAVRLTARSATALHARSGGEYAERDLFVGEGSRTSVLGPAERAGLQPDPERRQVAYRRGARRITLHGGPVLRGAGDYADWRLAFLRPLV